MAKEAEARSVYHDLCSGLPLGSVMAAYKEEFGYQLRPDMFKLESVNQLVGKSEL